MDVTRKRARAWLRMCSRIELDRAMEEARLTEQQREVIELMFTRGLSLVLLILAISWVTKSRRTVLRLNNAAARLIAILTALKPKIIKTPVKSPLLSTAKVKLLVL